VVAARTSRLALLVLATAAAVQGAQETSAPPRAPLGDREKERFLLQAEIASVHPAPGGETGSLRATLRRGELSHDVDIQTIDEESLRKDLGTVELDFRDSYKNDVAAYRLDRMLGVGMVPVTVLREHAHKPAAFTWWVDDAMMTEKQRFDARVPPPDVARWNRELSVVGVFDQLIFNFDRNGSNLVIDRDWRVWMLDHSRAFKTAKGLRNPRALGDSCEKGLLVALRALDLDAVRATMKDVLSDGQVEGLLARRDHIVAYFDRLIADRGEMAVLYELPTRSRGAR
jgi:hypothetical protein